MSILMRNFQALASEAFAFLEADFGYERRLITEGSLRYETQNVFVVVGYDGQRSFELSLDVWQRSAAVERSFNFGEVLRTVKAPAAVSSSYQVTSEEALKRFLKDLAQALRKYGVDFLQNNIAAFAQIAQLRDQECSQYALERNLRRVRAEAEAAWQKKDYPAVVKALKPWRAALTATEVGKLEFAERKTV